MSSSDIVNLILHEGDVRSRGALREGQIRSDEIDRKRANWDSVIRAISAVPSQIMQFKRDQREGQQEDRLAQQQQMQMDAQQRGQQLNATVNELMSGAMNQNEDGSVTFDRPKLQQRFQQSKVPLPIQAQALKSLDDIEGSLGKVAEVKREHFADVANGLLSVGDSPGSMAMAIAHVKANKLLSDQELAPLMEAAASGQDLKPFLKSIRAMSPKYKEADKPVVVAPGSALMTPSGETVGSAPARPVSVAPGGSLVKPDTGETVFTAPDRPSPKQSKSVLLDGKPAEVTFEPNTGKFYNADGEDVSARVKPMPPASVVYPSANNNTGIDPKSIASEIMAGNQPPDINTRTRYGMAVQSELAKQHYDLSQAVTDWKATQKHISSMNSTQQLRLNQAINQLPDLLDSVDDLASKWKGGRFPVLNRVNLAAAKNGVYGEDVASIARQLDTQIADVTGDLGAVYMGGNSPTDHSLKLAEKALSGDWSEKVLHDMVALARKNVRTRQNSVKSTGVSGASDSNPYAAPQAPPVDGLKVGGFTVREKK